MLKIKYMPIDELTPYEGNAKIHDKQQVEQIAESIRQFGFADPIAVWGEDNTVIEGHGRLLAAQKLGMDKVPVIRLDSLTDEQRRAYTLIHNQLTMNSGFNADMLAIELEDITGIDMTEFGFSLEDSDESFSIDDFEGMPTGYNKDDSEREYFEFSFQIPIQYRDTVAPYLRKHRREMIERFIQEAQEAQEGAEEDADE